MASMWSEKEVMCSWSYRESYSDQNGPFFVFFQRTSKSGCKFDSGLFQPILGLKISPVMIWIVLGCCWVSQIRTKPGKNIWGPSLDSITSYYVQCPWKIVSFLQVFRHLNYHILVFSRRILACIGRQQAGMDRSHTLGQRTCGYGKIWQFGMRD